MTNNNDERILEMKKKIAEKTEKLSKMSKRFSPITNCSIIIRGVRHNIQVLDKENLVSLMVELNALLMSAKDLDVAEEYGISGYSLVDWIADIKSRIEIMSLQTERKSLKVMEDKLVQLLSDGKKVELEIDEIESMLK